MYGKKDFWRSMESVKAWLAEPWCIMEGAETKKHLYGVRSSISLLEQLSQIYKSDITARKLIIKSKSLMYKRQLEHHLP